MGDLELSNLIEQATSRRWRFAGGAFFLLSVAASTIVQKAVSKWRYEAHNNDGKCGKKVESSHQNQEIIDIGLHCCTDPSRFECHPLSFEPNFQHAPAQYCSAMQAVNHRISRTEHVFVMQKKEQGAVEIAVGDQTRKVASLSGHVIALLLAESPLLRSSTPTKHPCAHLVSSISSTKAHTKCVN
jgi:hypothetical protein